MLAEPAAAEGKSAEPSEASAHLPVGAKDPVAELQRFVRRVMVTVDVLALVLVLSALVLLFIALAQDSFYYRKDWCEMKDSMDVSIRGCSPDYCCNEQGGQPTYRLDQPDLLDLTTHGQVDRPLIPLIRVFDVFSA